MAQLDFQVCIILITLLLDYSICFCFCLNLIHIAGGFIDDTDESLEHGLNRELEEEINLSNEYFVTKSDHFYSVVNNKEKLILHFYVKQVSMEQFKQIELDCLKSHDWGGEVAGILRPPLFTYNDKKKNDKIGFKKFLNNRFIGNASYQLLKAVHNLGLFNKQEIIDTLSYN